MTDSGICDSPAVRELCPLQHHKGFVSRTRFQQREESLGGGFTDTVETRIIVEVNFAQCGSFKLSLQPTASCSDTRLELPAENGPLLAAERDTHFPAHSDSKNKGKR